MNLRSTNKINSTFSMSSMTDIIFLLLIFFMLTASFVTPSGLPVNLPSSKSSTISIQKVSVTITKDLKYFVNDKESDENLLEAHIRDAIGNDEGLVVLHCDKDVPVEKLVNVAGIATSLEAKVTIATIPKKQTLIMDNKNIERKALYLTVLSNFLFFLLLMIIVAWKETYPPPEEYGIEIGTEIDSNDDSDDINENSETDDETELDEEVIEQTQESNNEEINNNKDIKTIQDEVIENEEEIITELEESVLIENKDKLIESNENDLPKEKTDDEVLVDGEKKIEERAIYSNSSSLSSKGSSLDMQGWTWDFAPKPDDKSTEGGRIVFEIIVDYYGEIIGLKTLETTLSPMVENIYREEILKLTFSPTNNENPAELSKGKITFIIKNN